jgi:hypothetical protein
MTKLYQSCLWALRSVAVLFFWGDLASVRFEWIVLDALHELALMSCPAAFLFCLMAILCNWSPPAPHPGDLKNVEN